MDLRNIQKPYNTTQFTIQYALNKEINIRYVMSFENTLIVFIVFNFLD